MWYRAYDISYGGKTNSEPFVEKICGLVKQNGVGNLIPRVLVGDPYLFVGINTDNKGQIPEQVKWLLDGITLGPVRGEFLYEDIKNMISSEVDTTTQTYRIEYRPPSIIPPENPIDLYELEEHVSNQPTDQAILALNRLLYWVSATGSGTWPTFKNACDKLTSETVDLDARQIFRRLRLLGHIEYTKHDGSKWSVCPPVLVQTSTPNTYFLSGQRVPRLVDAVAEQISIETMIQPTGEAPNKIQVQIESPDEAQTLITDDKIQAICSLRWAGHAANKLEAILFDLDGYRASLSSVSGFVISNFDIHRWNGKEFASCHFNGETGMYRLVPHAQKSSSFTQTLFFDADEHRWKTGDWYGLRYLAQQLSGSNCSVRYNHNTHCLMLPKQNRWPDLYERALVLASGFLPIMQDNWLYFGEVSVELARGLSQKLNATLVER